MTLFGKIVRCDGEQQWNVDISREKSTDVSKLSSDELAKVSGSDLLASTPEIANWLETVCTDYTYLDGVLHVQLSLNTNYE